MAGTENNIAGSVGGPGPGPYDSCGSQAPSGTIVDNGQAQGGSPSLGTEKSCLSESNTCGGHGSRTVPVSDELSGYCEGATRGITPSVMQQLSLRMQEQLHR